MSYTNPKNKTASSEGKAYTYQQPTPATAPGGAQPPNEATSASGVATDPAGRPTGGTSPLSEDKQKFMSAVSDLIDALSAAATNCDAAAKPVPTSIPGSPPAGGSAVAPSTGTPSMGTPSMGTPSMGTPSSGTPSSGTGHASGSNASGAGTGGVVPLDRPSGGEASPSGQDSAAETAESVMVLREQYRIDREREMARKATRSKETASELPGGMNGHGAPVDGQFSNKHTSDSNRAPLTEARAFSPSFGDQGKTNAPTMEKMTAPSGRPETVPAAGVVHTGKPIDAYWASFGTAVERAAVRARRDQIQTQQFEVIIGTDDRVQVTNTEAYPWRCICSLLITAQSGTQYVGTGWLVSPRLVLTAGHCVYMADDGGWAASIEVTPGRRGDRRPYGSIVSRELRSVTGWTRDNNSEFDYGAIILPEDCRYGDQLGWFGFASRTDDQLRNLTLNLSGYPGDGGPTHQPSTQWWHSRQTKSVLDRELTYEIDTFGGQSGSPVWEFASDGGRYGVGIHTHGATVSNGATRITRDVFDNIMRWAGQAP